MGATAADGRPTAADAPDGVLARALDAILTRIRAEGRDVLLEPEGLALARLVGLAVPHFAVLDGPDDAATLELDAFGGDRVVVKALSPSILHRSDVGGVRVTERRREAVVSTLERMHARLGGEGVRWLIEEFVDAPPVPGGELLLGVRVTREFGPVVTVAPGGVLAEDLAAALRPDEGPVIAAPGFEECDALGRALERRRFLRPVVHGVRGRPPLLGLDRLRTLVRRLLELARVGAPLGLLEFEVNPVLLTPDGPVAVDALGRVGPRPDGAADTLPRPLERIQRLLHPRTIAVAGVSERMNPGRVILRNVLDAGFEPERVTVVKPGVERLDGCACVADVSDLPAPVDLLVLSLAAEAVAPVLERVVAGDLAASVILVAGGMDTAPPERAGEPTPAERVRAALRDARAAGRPAPVVNGPNCLGVRSVPARYDTLFIPRSKLAVPDAPPAPVALLSQSGAFAVARMSRLAHLNPRYVVSVGNQLDLTISDYLRALEADEHVRVAACYVEGFQPGDGEAFMHAAARWTAAGRSVLLYRAGRTRAGARAAASHTASLAGDYTVTRELAALAGVHVADGLAEFQDLLTLLAAWADRPAPGRRLAVVSNAGFECVAMADRIAGRELAELTPATRDALGALVRGARLEGVVPVANPLDLTPICDDAAFVEAVRLVIGDPHVDVALVGCVPLTPALRTLPEEWKAGPPEGSLVDGLVRLWRETSKPWAMVVDAGPAYEPLRARLRAGGVPVLDYADRELPMS